MIIILKKSYLDPELEGVFIGAAGPDHAEAIAWIEDIEGVELVSLQALTFDNHALHVPITLKRHCMRPP